MATPGIIGKVVNVGRLVDLGAVAATVAAQPVSATSRPCIAVILQNSGGSASTILVGDALRQSREVTAGNAYTVAAGDANQVYFRIAAGSATVSRQILE